MSENFFSRGFWTCWPLEKFQKANSLYSNQFCCEVFQLLIASFQEKEGKEEILHLYDLSAGIL